MDHSGTSRCTLYTWKQAYHEQRLTGLMLHSEAPRTKQPCHWSGAVVSRIRPSRWDFPNRGKKQIHALLEPWRQVNNLAGLSVSTIGRLIADVPDLPAAGRTVFDLTEYWDSRHLCSTLSTTTKCSVWWTYTRPCAGDN